MTKGAAYREYYLKNAERIRAVNRERSAAYRAKRREADEAEREAGRAKEREAYARRKLRTAKEEFERLSGEAAEPLRPLFRTLADAKDLPETPPAVLRWLKELKLEASS